MGSPPAHKTQGPISRNLFEASTSTLKAHKTPHLSSETANCSFRVFTWLNKSFESSRGGVTIISPETQFSEILQDLTEIDDFLEHKTDLNQKLTYRGCPSKSREEVYRLIAEDRRTITDAGVTEYEQTRRKQYETKVDIVNAAESLFQFFLPPNLKGPTVDKFWGALYRLLEVRVKTPFNYMS
jgi:hypothetical protein